MPTGLLPVLHIACHIHTMLTPLITRGHYFIRQLSLLHPHRSLFTQPVCSGVHLVQQAVVFRVFTDGAEIVCLPLVESLHTNKQVHCIVSEPTGSNQLQLSDKIMPLGVVCLGLMAQTTRA
jgi:hypothetical protein